MIKKGHEMAELTISKLDSKWGIAENTTQADF